MRATGAEASRREAARSAWISRMIAAQEEERRRIAHELHDEAIQSLVLLCRRIDAVNDATGTALPAPARDSLAAARRQTEDLIASLRNLTRDLRPPALDDLGVVACVRQLLADLGGRAGIDWRLTTQGTPCRLAREAELGLYRIAQEAIRNVERHAGATAIVVSIAFGPGKVTLTVSDNGRGLTTAEWDEAVLESSGLLGMQERARLLGGELVIQSRPEQGTTAQVTVPT